MIDKKDDFRAIVEARDTTIATLQQLHKQLWDQLLEKEANIHGLKTGIAELELLRKAHQDAVAALERVSRDSVEKEAVIRELKSARDSAQNEQRHILRALEEKEAVIHELKDAYERAQKEHAHAIGKVTRTLQEQAHLLGGLDQRHLQQSQLHETTNQMLGQTIQAVDVIRAGVDFELLASSGEIQRNLLLGLKQKEAVIQELSKAIEAHRMAHSALVHLARPMRAYAGIRRGLRDSTKGLAKPKLGNLNQHAPVDLKLPSSYYNYTVPKAAPRISIVTPSFRQAAFIERTIKSVLEQRYPNLEYFVQDGGSNDGTREILERFSDQLSGWESHPDEGQSQAINLGFARTQGEIMAWLNSDDILLPGALACVASYFAAHPQVDVVYGHRLLIDENDRQIGRWIMPAHDDKVLSWADFVPQETLFWRRRIWEKVGAKIDESFCFAMDWDLLVRFRDAGAKFVRLPRALGGFRIHTQQKTSAAISDIGFKEMDRIRERALGKVPSGTQIRTAIGPYLAKHFWTDWIWQLRNTQKKSK